MLNIGNNSYHNPDKVNILKDYESVQIKDPDGGNYDYIIVGTESAGSVIAGRLLKGTNAKVLVLETGERRAVYEYEATPLVNNRAISLNRCQIYSFSRSFSSTISAIGNKYDYDDWAAAGYLFTYANDSRVRRPVNSELVYA